MGNPAAIAGTVLKTSEKPMAKIWAIEGKHKPTSDSPRAAYMHFDTTTKAMSGPFKALPADGTH